MIDIHNELLVWLGIVFCLTQSAMFSGLNLALLGISRLRLEVEASSGNTAAKKILALRKDFNFLLTTILWGNVGINVLLTLLSNSVLTGISAFIFSTFLITFFGEITPQAYFSRHAMRIGSALAPVIRFYQIGLYPLAKPTALILDWWLGEEGIKYFKESDLRTVIHKHIDAEESDVGRLEGIGALNFLALDDVVVTSEGEVVDPHSIIFLPKKGGKPEFPGYSCSNKDPFLQKIDKARKKWVIIVDESNQPYMVLNSNAFLRNALFSDSPVDPVSYCHSPIIVTDTATLLGKVLSRLKVLPEADADDVIDDDLILVWAEERRVITGADILGRLLRGIAIRDIRQSALAAGK